jgi:hypothetical protein
MQRLIVNKEDVTLDSGAKTWGELLASLDTTCHAQGRVVTAARLDGVDEPSFREPSVGGRALDAVAVVEVDAETPATLLAEAIREASFGLDQLCGHALEVGRHFRGHDLAPAQQGLLELVQGLQVLTSLIATVSAVLQTDMGTLTWQGKPVASLLDGLGVHLESLIDAQQREDWLTVADIVEFDIEPALRACRPLLEALSASGVCH